MNLVYKWYFIEREVDPSCPEHWPWCITPVYQYISHLKDGEACDWDFFGSLSDAKIYIDLISNQ